MAKDKKNAGDQEMSRIDQVVADAKLGTATLAGDLRDAMLDIRKTQGKPWPEMTHDEQESVGRGFEYTARELVEKCVEIVGEALLAGKPIRAILDKYTDSKNGIVATMSIRLPEDDDGEGILALHQAQGKLMMLTPASPQDFGGESEPFEADADQSDMEFEAGSDEVEPDTPDGDESEVADAGDENAEG